MYPASYVSVMEGGPLIAEVLASHQTLAFGEVRFASTTLTEKCRCVASYVLAPFCFVTCCPKTCDFASQWFIAFDSCSGLKRTCVLQLMISCSDVCFLSLFTRVFWARCPPDHDYMVVSNIFDLQPYLENMSNLTDV